MFLYVIMIIRIEWFLYVNEILKIVLYMDHYENTNKCRDFSNLSISKCYWTNDANNKKVWGFFSIKTVFLLIFFLSVIDDDVSSIQSFNL